MASSTGSLPRRPSGNARIPVLKVDIIRMSDEARTIKDTFFLGLCSKFVSSPLLSYRH